MTSSASKPSASAYERPIASKISRIIGNGRPTSSGGSSGPATRCVLYIGSASTLKAGRQSLSSAMIRREGQRSGRSRLMKFRKPYAAWTFVPSGSFISGTEWYARYRRLAASTRSSGPVNARSDADAAFARGHLAGAARILPRRGVDDAAERLRGGLEEVVRIAAAQLCDVQRQPAGLRDRLEEMRHQRRVEAADDPLGRLEVVRERGPAAEVDGHIH